MSDEKVIWRNRPAEISLTPTQRAVFWSLLVVASASFSAAIAVATTLHTAVGGMILVAGWTAAVALVFRAVIQWWHEGAEYLVTESRVLWQRGRFARSIQRNGISFARITWLDPERGVGDLELVRDVAEGVFRRKLTIELRGVHRPDVLWDIIRAGDDRKHDPHPSWHANPLGQRLRNGERVEWSERPAFTLRRLIPTSSRGVTGVVFGVLIVAALVRTIFAAYTGGQHVLAAGVPAASVGFVALMLSTSLTAMLMFALGGAVVWTAVLRPIFKLRDTRYLITSTRVLISQGDEELHLDRAKIVDVIDNVTPDGTHDLFLVVGGSPRARSVGMSGAFDENAPRSLVPVFRLVVDAESAEKLLRNEPEIKRAA
jgi:membrane protein implicated in regulation of membrane protease activity